VIELWDRYDADRRSLGFAAEFFREAFVETVESAIAMGDLDRAADLLGMVRGLRPGERPPSLDAHVDRLASKLALTRGDGGSVEAGLRSAAEVFRRHGVRFWAAVTVLELAEWLEGQGRTEEARPLLEEAGGTFEDLRATPWVERAAAAGAPVGAEAMPGPA
jgi:ATP/maltotriose-dependent transcriptional regulator MalT